MLTTSRFLVLACLCVVAAAASVHAAVLEDITSHNAAGRTVFLVVTDRSAQGLAQARAVAEAARQRTPDSAVVELDRSDPAQRAAVAKYRVAGSPVPLVLVIARNGFAVGAARPGAAKALARLVRLVPTPRKAEYLKTLSERRVAMVVFSRRSMEEQGPLFEQISATARTPKLRMSTVLIDLDDASEHRFVAEWKLDPAKVRRPLLVFVNPKGQIIGRLQGAPRSSQIIQMARKKVRGCQCGDPNCGGHK